MDSGLNVPTKERQFTSLFIQHRSFLSQNEYFQRLLYVSSLFFLPGSEATSGRQNDAPEDVHALIPKTCESLGRVEKGR